MTDDPSDPSPQSPWGAPPPDQAPFQRSPSYPPPSPIEQQQPYGQPPAYPPQQPYAAPQQPYGAPPSYQSQPYGNQYWQGQPPNAGTNGFAIAALVLGIIWVFWLGSLLAVIFGHIALAQIKRTGQSGHGMALAGVILGYIGIALFAFFVIVGLAVGDDTV